MSCPHPHLLSAQKLLHCEGSRLQRRTNDILQQAPIQDRQRGGLSRIKSGRCSSLCQCSARSGGEQRQLLSVQGYLAEEAVIWRPRVRSDALKPVRETAMISSRIIWPWPHLSLVSTFIYTVGLLFVRNPPPLHSPAESWLPTASYPKPQEFQLQHSGFSSYLPALESRQIEAELVAVKAASDHAAG